MVKCMHPLGKARASGDMLRCRSPTFLQNYQGQNKIRRAQAHRDPTRSLFAKSRNINVKKPNMNSTNGDAPNGWSENKSQAKSHADKAHLFRALLARCNVCDVRLGNGDVRAADAGERA